MNIQQKTAETVRTTNLSLHDRIDGLQVGGVGHHREPDVAVGGPVKALYVGA